MCEVMNEVRREIEEMKEMLREIRIALNERPQKEEKLLNKTELAKRIGMSKPTLNDRLKKIEYNGISAGGSHRKYDPVKVIEALEKLDH